MTAHDTAFYEEQAEHALQRFMRLRERGLAPGENEEQLVTEVLEELSAALHELRVSAQEMSDQNQMLLDAEGTIAAERTRYQELYDFAPDGYLVTDTHGMIRDCNRVGAELLRRKPESIIGKPMTMFVPMPQRRVLRLLLAQMARGDGAVRTLDMALTRPDRTTFDVVLRVISARSVADPRALELRWTMRDISDEQATRRALVDEAHHRLLAEQALRASEALYRHLVEHATDMVYELDENGCFKFCNEQATHRLLGFTERELIGRRLVDIVRPDRRKSVAASLAGLQRSRGGHSYLEFPVLAKDGREVWLGQHAAAVLVAGRGSSLQAVCRDITTQIQRVEQLERAGERWRDLSTHLQGQIEAERARIAREIHDELGAALTVVRMELSVPPDGDAPANGKRNEHLLKRIDNAIDSVRRICSDLRPSLLDNMGLGAAIEWLVQDVQERTDIRCELDFAGLPAELEPDRATALFRIVQEAVTNTVRHANASKLTIRQRARGTNVLISVADDGRGIRPEDQASRHAYGIVGMHERAKALDGRVRISGGPRGTQVLVFMPAISPPPREGDTDGKPKELKGNDARPSR